MTDPALKTYYLKALLGALGDMEPSSLFPEGLGAPGLPPLRETVEGLKLRAAHLDGQVHAHNHFPWKLKARIRLTEPLKAESRELKARALELHNREARQKEAGRNLRTKKLRISVPQDWLLDGVLP